MSSIWRVWKRSEEDSTGTMEWLEKNVRSDLRQVGPILACRRSLLTLYQLEGTMCQGDQQLCRLETVALTKRQEEEMEVADLKML